MTEHICGPWRESGWFGRKIICVFCNKEIQTKHVVARINEYRELLKAMAKCDPGLDSVFMQQFAKKRLKVK